MQSVLEQGHVNLAMAGKKDINGNTRWKYVFFRIDGECQYNYTKYMKGMGVVREGVLTTTAHPEELRGTLVSIEGRHLLKVFDELQVVQKRVDKCRSSIDRRGTITCDECREEGTCTLSDSLFVAKEDWDKASDVCESLKQGFILLPHL